MKEIFTAVPCEPCGKHEHLDFEGRMFFSCGCSLADNGHYWILWDGEGLGLVCEDKDDGERKAFMMNEAWHLSKGMTPTEITMRRLENKRNNKEEWS